MPLRRSGRLTRPNQIWSMRLVLVIMATIAVPSRAVLAQPSGFRVLRTLAETPKQVTAPLVEAADGGLYGIATGGAEFGKGAILRFDRHADGTLTFAIVHSFSAGEEPNPTMPLTLGIGGQLFGVGLPKWDSGGVHLTGSVFKVSLDGAHETLHVFPDAYPATPLVRANDGNLYGFTSDSTLFRLTPAGVVEPVSVLPGGITYMSAPILIASREGFLYATGNDGIFRITLTGDATKIAPAVPQPHALIEGGDGNLYGTTSVQSSCCPSGFLGYAFRITPTGVVTVLHLFTEGPSYALIEGDDGLLYGTTHGRIFNFFGIPDGMVDTVFRMARSGAAFETLHVFTSIEGNSSQGLMQAGDGAFYGSTSAGGLTDRGVIYRLQINGAFTPLDYFIDPTPLWLFGHLTQGADGFLYGTSCRGGYLNQGSVFRMTLAGEITVIHSFFGLDGACPIAGLVQAGDGNFYGTTRLGGLPGHGSVFRISPGGSFSVLHWFTRTDGMRPFAGLSIGSDGSLYGTTASGDPGGTIFRITTSGALSTLHSFVSGDQPYGGVIEGPDGNFYGGTTRTLFRLGPGSTFTVLEQQVGTFGSLFRASDGAMYGPGANGILKLTVAGDVTTFPFPNPAAFVNAPIQGIDGNFYGASATTCFGSCDGGPGLLYSMTPTGGFTILHSFAGSDGWGPFGRVVQASDGALYGATLAGGPGGAGVIYRMTPP